MAITLLLTWVIVFLCLYKGVQNSGKVVYFTALFPHIILIILFIRGILLPGAREGILFYLMPNWKRLLSAKVWGEAAVQVFFSLSPAWGGLITLSSYNKFHNNCYRDAWIVTIGNLVTSFFAGLFIFSVIGFLAHEFRVPVSSVVDQGIGLAFIVYPEAVTRLPLASLWSVLFFMMLFTLGLDSQLALIETVTTAILDGFPVLRKYKFWVVLATSVFGYLGGLIFTTNSGMYWLHLMDKYAANWAVLFIAISECIVVGWIYGADRFLDDVQQMVGSHSRFWRLFWKWMWKVITPATIFFILFSNWVEYHPLTYNNYVYPKWANIVGWIISMLPILVIIGVALVSKIKSFDVVRGEIRVSSFTK
ncbi:sodium- and chloride-dependent glycine transporter 1-like [Bombus fervidus]|uniref:sodium- and chloride-dependent glycine transporter 1-like n=1 Tax=Bombus fervidus TaxID=203811 RepID=UPI003AB90AB1